MSALVVVPVAVSWACGPNRAIQLDRYDYLPGAPVTVTGANFDVNAQVQIILDGTPITSTTASGGGNISASFPAPVSIGSHTVGTQGVNTEGQALAGTGGTQSFTVSAARSTNPAPSGGGSPSTRAPAPGSATGTQPGKTRQNGRNSTSGREPSRSGAGQRSGAGGSGSGSSGSGSGAGAGTGAGALNTNEGVIQAAGTTAFAGSVTRKDRAAAAKAKSGAGATTKARPTKATATADLWSGFASSKNPSLISGTSKAPEAGTSTGVVAGIALLGVGLLALLGLAGLVARDRRRSRSRAS